MGQENEDWLFPDAGKRKSELEERGLTFARNYLVFAGPTADPRACELFEHWTNWIRRQKVSSNDHGALAAHGALREFVENIAAQIDIANQGLNQPKPRK